MAKHKSLSRKFSPLIPPSVLAYGLKYNKIYSAGNCSVKLCIRCCSFSQASKACDTTFGLSYFIYEFHKIM